MNKRKEAELALAVIIDNLKLMVEEDKKDEENMENPDPSVIEQYEHFLSEVEDLDLSYLHFKIDNFIFNELVGRRKQ